LLKQLFETHLEVSNLERAMSFYETVLGLELGLKQESRRIAFYWIGGPMKSMIGLWERTGTPIAVRHTAFEIDLADMEKAVGKLRASGVAVKNFFDADTAEPSVFAWMPAVAIYFDDPDGNRLEIIARVPGGPEPELGIVGWSEWKKSHGI
jgi:lactoylglutathione lyase